MLENWSIDHYIKQYKPESKNEMCFLSFLNTKFLQMHKHIQTEKRLAWVWKGEKEEYVGTNLLTIYYKMDEIIINPRMIDKMHMNKTQ